MDNTKEKLHVTLNYDETQTIPLALYEMHVARADRRLFRVCVCWAVSIIVTVVSFVWLWNQYDYESSTTTTTTTEYSGVYNITDSEGNIISSDLTPEDVIRIMESLNGESSENSDTNENQETNE